MRIHRIAKLDISDFPKSLDCTIVASGYESRSRSIAMMLNHPPHYKISTKCAWGFTEYADDPIRKENDLILKNLGYHISVIPGGDAYSPEQWVDAVLAKDPDKPISILVDISAMTRTWYGGMIKALSRSERRAEVRCIFLYTPAEWAPGKRIPHPNEILGPVPGYSSHTLPNKPTALIIGLGIDEDRALGLRNQIDPRETICFYASPGSDPKYEKALLDANRDLLDSTRNESIFTYSLFDTFGAYKTLESACFGLSRDYRVVLASLGPKIFGLYCFLLSVTNPEISVWRVSPAARQKPVDHKSFEKTCVLEVVWGQQEVTLN